MRPIILAFLLSSVLGCTHSTVYVYPDGSMPPITDDGGDAGMPDDSDGSVEPDSDTGIDRENDGGADAPSMQCAGLTSGTTYRYTVAENDCVLLASWVDVHTSGTCEDVQGTVRFGGCSDGVYREHEFDEQWSREGFVWSSRPIELGCDGGTFVCRLIRDAAEDTVSLDCTSAAGVCSIEFTH